MWRGLWFAALIGGLGCGESGDDGGGHDDAAVTVDAPVPDAAGIRCGGEPAAVIGRCVIAGTGERCTGVEGEIPEFVALTDGESLSMVIGPQGQPMFVLALRASGIDPGGPEDSPDVAIQVRYLDMNVATYNARPPFEPATDDTATANNLFLIIAGPVETVQGQTLSVHAELADRTGEDRCADITIVAAAP